jgi:hypothetical protein
MKRALPFFLMLVYLCPHFAVSQDTTARDDSSKSSKPRRRATLARELWKDNAGMAAETARLAAEEVRLSAEMEMQLPFVMEESLHELHAVLPQTMELVGPALEQVEPALEQAMQALDFSMQELQDVPWPEINAELATLPEIFTDMPPFMDMPPLPDIPPIPPLPVLAPIPTIPPLPPIPPMPEGPWPVLHGELHGQCH